MLGHQGRKGIGWWISKREKVRQDTFPCMFSGSSFQVGGKLESVCGCKIPTDQCAAANLQSCFPSFLKVAMSEEM